MKSIFGKRMAEMRKESGLSQQALADILSTSVSVISKYERGEMTPSVETAKRIAKEIHISLDYLIGLIDNESVLKDRTMIDYFQKVGELPEEKRTFILNFLDIIIRDTKAEMAYR